MPTSMDKGGQAWAWAALFLDEIYLAAKGIGDGAEDVDGDAIAALLQPHDVWALQACALSKFGLCQSFRFAEGGDSLTHPLAFLFVAYHGLFVNFDF